MTTTKAPMTNSYKAIFIFAIVMAFVTLLAGNKAPIATLFWGYVVWMMYKRNNTGLITIFKLFLWLFAFSFFMGFVLLSNGTFDEKWFGFSAQGYFLTIIVVGAIDFGLLNYFKNLATQGKPLNNPTPNPTLTPILRTTQSETFTYKSYKDPVKDIDPKQQVSEVAMTEERIYLKINDELESGSTDKALWIKIFAEFDGDENKTKANYIKQRFKNLSSELGKRETASEAQAIEEARIISSISKEEISQYKNFYHVDEQIAIDMIRYKIYLNVGMFKYKTYRYESLYDAIAFAKLEESKLKS